MSADVCWDGLFCLRLLSNSYNLEFGQSLSDKAQTDPKRRNSEEFEFRRWELISDDRNKNSKSTDPYSEIGSDTNNDNRDSKGQNTIDIIIG